MATNSKMRPSTGGNIKQGICRNTEYLDPDKGTTGPCPKCASGEIQKVNVQRLSDFKCSVCGSKLEPVKTGLPKWLIPACVALVVFIGGGIFLAINSDKTTSTKDPDEVVEQPVDTIDHQPTDSVGPGKPGGEDPGDQAPPTTPRLVLGGAATLSTDGKTLTFNKRYILDLQSVDDETLTIYPNDKIVDANIINGVLRGGNFVSKSGDERYLSGIEVKL